MSADEKQLEKTAAADEKLNHIIMWIIAATLMICLLTVLAVHGVKGIPFGWVGVVVALLLTAGAVVMTRVGGKH